jgi:dTDP-4-dehydrorhamnose reductase
MLGTDLCSVLGRDYEVRGYDLDDFDIVDAGRTSAAVREISPSVIIHAAAFTDVDGCEDDKERALLVNSTGTENVAKAAREAGCFMVYMSTDYVFDGSKASPYTEADSPRPINHYGLTKYYGEKYVFEIVPAHLVVRTSWLFGPNGRNFVDTIIGKALKTGSLRVVSDQRGCPTYTRHLAVGIGAVIERGLQGIVHLTNSGDATWFDLAEYALETAGIRARITAVDTGAYPTRARRPAYTVLGSDVSGKAGVKPLPHWKQGVKEHLARRELMKDEGTS